MDSEQKGTIVVVVLFLGLLLGGLELSKALDPYTLQVVMFRGEEERVAVYTNRRAIAVGNFVVHNEVFERNGNMMTRVVLAVPRRGILTWERTASNHEAKLFRRFF